MSCLAMLMHITILIAGLESEDDVPTDIYCERLDKYEVNQANGEPATANTDDRVHPDFA